MSPAPTVAMPTVALRTAARSAIHAPPVPGPILFARYAFGPKSAGLLWPR